MSGRVGHRKRLVCVTAGNLRQNHLNLTGHADYFPADCYGSATKGGKRGKLLRLDVGGLAEPDGMGRRFIEVLQNAGAAARIAV